jgi:hypothetical protein
MLTFIVPVKSKEVSKDWSKFCNLFERTLISICSQTDTNYKVVVVCHEKPEISFRHDNVHYMTVDFEPPIKTSQINEDEANKLREIDKGKKLQLGAQFAKQRFDTDYVMTVDSDDFISNRIAGFVNKQNKTIPGWYVKNGYIFLKGKKFLLKTYKFNYLCGSSVIVKPDLLQHFFDVDSILYFDHRLKVLNETIKLRAFPFFGGIYSIANGENHLMHGKNIKKFNTHKDLLSLEGIKRLLAKIRNYSLILITRRTKQEFSFNT